MDYDYLEEEVFKYHIWDIFDTSDREFINFFWEPLVKHFYLSQSKDLIGLPHLKKSLLRQLSCELLKCLNDDKYAIKFEKDVYAHPPWHPMADEISPENLQFYAFDSSKNRLIRCPPRSFLHGRLNDDNDNKYAVQFEDDFHDNQPCHFVADATKKSPLDKFFRYPQFFVFHPSNLKLIKRTMWHQSIMRFYDSYLFMRGLFDSPITSDAHIASRAANIFYTQTTKHIPNMRQDIVLRLFKIIHDQIPGLPIPRTFDDVLFLREDKRVRRFRRVFFY
jgi:hypothetical protein